MRAFDEEKLLENIKPTKFDRSIFGQYSHVSIEIGAGTGMFALEYAKKNPENLLISIEKTSNKFRKFQKAYESDGSPSNLLPIHSHGVSWVASHLNDREVDAFYFLYPNPNPKKGDRNKRFHNMPFMEKVFRCLKSKGKIYMATNEGFFAEEAVEVMTKVWSCRLVSWDKKKSGEIKPRTLFEKKYLERNQIIHDLIFERPE